MTDKLNVKDLILIISDLKETIDRLDLNCSKLSYPDYFKEPGDTVMYKASEKLLSIVGLDLILSKLWRIFDSQSSEMSSSSDFFKHSLIVSSRLETFSETYSSYLKVFKF